MVQIPALRQPSFKIIQGSPSSDGNKAFLFTEDFDNADLKDAKALLDEFNGGG